MRYLLNSAVLTAFGRWDYQPCTPGDAQRFLAGAPLDFPTEGETIDWLNTRLAGTPGAEVRSTIGYAETAAALEQLCGLPAETIPVNRQTITMQPGDEALVFRLVFPSGTRPDAVTKGHLGADFLAQHSELGLLRRLA